MEKFQLNDSIHSVIITDCGSTTTKARLFEKSGSTWKFSQRGESPTTVEAPIEDVTYGVKNSIKELEEVTKKTFLLDENLSWSPGVLFLSTSSAGGGLQILCAGGVKNYTCGSAERAALGAGAILLDALSFDDVREDPELIQSIRELKPDMILLVGGVDGGAKHFALKLAEILRAAAPKPRFGASLKLPVIFAGNKDVYPQVQEILKEVADIFFASNVRPEILTENIHEAREVIHELFLTHVMSHSPGYEKLIKATPEPILPTPSAVGDMVQVYAKNTKKNLLCVDIGGATTDIFSCIFDSENVFNFHRSVSANFGMSYSIGNVLVKAGVRNIKRWLNFDISDSDLKDILRNKMIRPTTIPQTREDLFIEQAVSREALRLSLEHHKTIALSASSSLKKEKLLSNLFSQDAGRNSLINMKNIDVVIGSGGVLSHAPTRLSAAMMIIDGFALEGVTEILIDSVFLLPHLGVFSTVNEHAALEILQNDCLIPIGSSIVPTSRKKVETYGDIFIHDKKVATIHSGEVLHIPEQGKKTIKCIPHNATVDFGEGAGKMVEREVLMGVCGLIVDGRNRPFAGNSVFVELP